MTDQDGTIRDLAAIIWAVAYDDHSATRRVDGLLYRLGISQNAGNGAIAAGLRDALGIPAAALVTVTPGPHEIALARVPAGTPFQFPLRTGELRDVPPYGEVRWAEVPGSALPFWGVDLMIRDHAHGIGLARKKAERALWQRAARMLAGHPETPAVIYVLLKETSPYGRPVWLADSIRQENPNA